MWEMVGCGRNVRRVGRIEFMTKQKEHPWKRAQRNMYASTQKRRRLRKRLCKYFKVRELPNLTDDEVEKALKEMECIKKEGRKEIFLIILCLFIIFSICLFILAL